MSALHPGNEILPPRERGALTLYLVTTLALLLVLMVFGLLMRMAQGTWLHVPPTLFYQLMTAHGAGMVGTVALGGSAVMWYFLRKYVSLSLPIFLTNYTNIIYRNIKSCIRFNKFISFYFTN